VAGGEGFTTPEIAAAWNAEIENRVMETREGQADGIPAEEVMAKASNKLHEARRLRITA
jgi:hypothetical protein